MRNSVKNANIVEARFHLEFETMLEGQVRYAHYLVQHVQA